MTPEDIIQATSTLVASVEASLELARTSFNRDAHAWIEKQISQHLGPNIGNYAAYLQSLAVNDIDEVKQVFKKNFSNAQVREAYDELLNVEEEWDNFLVCTDAVLNAGASPAIQEGQSIQDTILLQNVRNGETVNLEALVSGDDKYLHLVLLRHFA